MGGAGGIVTMNFHFCESHWPFLYGGRNFDSFVENAVSMDHSILIIIHMCTITRANSFSSNHRQKQRELCIESILFQIF